MADTIETQQPTAEVVPEATEEKKVEAEETTAPETNEEETNGENGAVKNGNGHTVVTEEKEEEEEEDEESNGHTDTSTEDADQKEDTTLKRKDVDADDEVSLKKQKVVIDVEDDEKETIALPPRVEAWLVDTIPPTSEVIAALQFWSFMLASGGKTWTENEYWNNWRFVKIAMETLLL